MGKKGTKRKTRWRVLPIGEDGGSGSGNEEEADCDTVGGGSSGSYARATQQRMPRRPGTRLGNPNGGYYNKQQQYHHHPRSFSHHDSNQPLVTTEKQIFNEEEYTKITTPRQDVLFKKGYLGRKRPTITTETSDQTTADVANGNGLHYEPAAMHNEDGLDNDLNELVEEQPQFIYTNGFVDQSGVYYINGSGYEMYDPYTGHVTVLVGPHYGPNGGPPVLAAVPCQPVPLQPLEWFNPPGFLPYVTAPCQNGLARDRRKRYSTDSQNYSPQSSESTGPPGSPQESDEVALNGGGEGVMYHPHHPPPPPYVYPGYMFGAPMYNMNGVTVQSTPNEAPSCDVNGKRRKKKRRRRRRRNGVEDGSEESSSEDKELEEEPMSVTSQESSLESDSKLSTAGETVDAKSRPQLVDEQPPPDVVAVDVIVTKSNVQTQTVIEKQEVVEPHQRPNPDSKANGRRVDDPVDVDSKVAKSLPQETKKETKVSLVNGSSCIGVKEVKENLNEVVSQPKLNGSVNGKGCLNKEGIVTGEKLVNGHDVKSKVERKTEKKGKKLNGLTNGIVEKPREVVENHIEAKEDVVFEDDSFVYTQEFINGNVSVELDEESEWITVKGHKGSQGKRSDSARANEEKKFSFELTNGHVKSNRDNGHKVNGVGGKDKVFHKNNSDKFKTDKNYVNGKVDEKCTYTKVKQNESISKEKTTVNGKGKFVNGNKMDGNEKELPTKGKEMESGIGDAKVATSTEMSESPDVSKKSIQQVEETTPMKPSRKERKSLKNGSPPKKPESTLTVTAKPFEMPSVSLRPETFVNQSVTSTALPNYLSHEDSLLAALTVEPKETKSMEDIAKDIKSTLKQVLESSSKDVTTVTETTKKPISIPDQKQKAHDGCKGSSVLTKVTPLKDLASKTIGKDQIPAGTKHQTQDVLQMASSRPSVEVKSLKDTSKDFLARERQNVERDVSKTLTSGVDELKGSKVSDEQKKEPENAVAKGRKTNEMGSDPEVAAPIPPPRRKKLRQGKRTGSERVSSIDITVESTDESSSSSSQESEESVIECLSSGFNSPKTKIVAELSDEDEEIIFQGKLGENEPKPLGRISESSEETNAVQNGKSSTRNGGTKTVVPQPRIVTSEAIPEEKATQKFERTSKFKETKDTFSDTYKSEEHLRNVQIMAKEIVDSVIDEAMQESVRLKYQTDSDPSKLGITDAVTRWLRSQSPDVLSVPNNDDSESEVSEDLEEDTEDEMTTGSKNLKSNPLPAPSVKDFKNQLNSDDLIGLDGTGRRVANKSSEKKYHRKETRNNTSDLEDDTTSNDSIPCGEWDLWDCQQTIAQNYYEILDKSNMKQTKNTSGINIISPETTLTNSPIFIHKSVPLVPEYVNLPDGQRKYDPLANDTFSPVENTPLNELVDPASPVQDRCSYMCDPALSVAKYYILGPKPRRTLSNVDDLDCSDSDDSSLTKHNEVIGETCRMSLADELARLDQPLPASWAVEPLRVERTTKQRRCPTCNCNGPDCGAPVDSGVESGDEVTVTRKREGMSVFKRKLVGRLKGEGAPFPCGGICCILQ